LLERSDIVSMNLTLGDETRGFLDAGRIARMKKGAIFINTARGALTDEAGADGGAESRPPRACGA
jgi:D-3-phosphoglycerate dehydrogenase